MLRYKLMLQADAKGKQILCTNKKKIQDVNEDGSYPA